MKKKKNGNLRKKLSRIQEAFTDNKEIYIVMIIMGVLFLAMIIYFMLFMTLGRDEVLENPNNNRYDASVSKIVRGEIRTIDGAAIALTEKGEEISSDRRVYPYGSIFAPITGYACRGKTGLEASQNRRLLTSSLPLLERLRNDFLGIRSSGDHVVTTIDSDLQNYCYQLLQNYSGSITVMDPKTGKILAMVSNPTYDPNTVLENWNSLTSPENTSGNLMNRCTQGLYVPGSTFKIITLLEYMRENPKTYEEFTYNCTGSCQIEDMVVTCEGGIGHGEQNIVSAMANSCNCAFIQMGMTLDKDKFGELCRELGFGKRILEELPCEKSRMNISYEMSDKELMQTAFGQGKTMETPLQNLMITSMIANGGQMMQPYLIQGVVNGNGEAVSETKPKKIKDFLTEKQVEYYNACLTATINNGTSTTAASPVCQIAGKSGTAQVTSSMENMHAWFTAYAPAEDAKIAVTVMLENAGHGSEFAAPIARDIITYYLTR